MKKVAVVAGGMDCRSLSARSQDFSVTIPYLVKDAPPAMTPTSRRSPTSCRCWVWSSRPWLSQLVADRVVIDVGARRFNSGEVNPVGELPLIFSAATRTDSVEKPGRVRRERPRWRHPPPPRQPSRLYSPTPAAVRSHTYLRLDSPRTAVGPTCSNVSNRSTHWHGSERRGTADDRPAALPRPHATSALSESCKIVAKGWVVQVRRMPFHPCRKAFAAPASGTA